MGSPCTTTYPAECAFAAGSHLPDAVIGAMSDMPRRKPVADPISPRLADRANLLVPQDIEVSGWLGSRIASNGQGRLAPMDTTPLLAGFKQRPGSHPWIGEHVGKYLDALSLEWARTGNKALRTKGC